mgnify:CR=1 FL=1
MASLQLVVRPDGRAFLTTRERLSRAAIEELTRQIREWQDGTWPIAVIPDCEVVQVNDVALDLEPAAEVPA